jgi:metal-responsive CopG/Arc/MetJ family transcriptional regulator
VSISLPITLLKELDIIAEELHISRSALLTAGISFLTKWMKDSSIIDKKTALNSVYGKKG